MALGAERQISDLTEVHKRQASIGYPSQLIVGEAEVRDYMKTMFPDWRAQGVHVCLHEEKGGLPTTWHRCTVSPARPRRPAQG